MRKLVLLLLGNIICTSLLFGSIYPVRNGKALYSIVISATPTQEEFKAADYLQRYLFRITGATLPIVSDRTDPLEKEICIGTSNRLQYGLENLPNALENDEFLIKTQNKKLFILGGAKKGLFYGVITFLEKFLGCRKYSPTFEYIPKESTLVLPDNINFRDKPLNNYRVIYGNFTADKEYKDWNKLNEIDDVFGEGYYVHTFWKIIRPGIYFDEHPEYFALINGERSAKQPCLSNPEVLKIAIAHLEKEIPKQPTRTIWSVSQNDNKYYCHCPECMKIMEEEGSPSGPIIRFVNKIAEHFPDKIISTLAYTYSRKAPKKTRPASNVQIMLSTIELNRNVPIEVDTANTSFMKDMQDWQRITKNLYLWDYTVNFSHNVSPFPNLHVLQSNLQFFSRSGIKDQFQQANTEFGYDFAELKSYLLARLLWNPFQKADSILVDFFKGYYGQGATWIKQYAYHLERETARSRENLNIYGSPIWHSSTFLSEENIKFYKACFDSALMAVKEDSTLTAHVEVAYLPLRYAILEIGKKDMMGPRGWFIQNGDMIRLRPEIKKELDQFYYNCRKYKVKTLNEAGLTPKEYYLSTIRFLIPQISNNLAFNKKITAHPNPNTMYSAGDLMMLTNGFVGTNDFTFQWIGWEGTDFELILDLEKIETPSEICLSSLNNPMNWAFYPNKITCYVSESGDEYRAVGVSEVNNNEKIDEITRNFCFKTSLGKVRYIKFKMECTKTLPLWQTTDRQPSWTFLDEIIVRP
ncbi:MAG TPA: DUF4838 domain-containing protein [Bacteroidales bacterium]|nr:DUF4838 domain-containing protein [Bacteroidales bacterium]